MAANRVIIASHQILNGYGHWLGNDPRGSGSTELRNPKLEELGPIHFGRKRIQPRRDELREFYRKAEPLLKHETLWFDEQKRRAIAEAVSRVIAERKYTVWACAVMRDHLHLLVRSHRNRSEVIWDVFATATCRAICSFSDVDPNHPVWSTRPYEVFCYTPDDVRRDVDYIRKNPAKSGLAPQEWEFVTPYDGGGPSVENSVERRSGFPFREGSRLGLPFAIPGASVREGQATLDVSSVFEACYSLSLPI
jgi:REP element-mobilizing transposase RayT